MEYVPGNRDLSITHLAFRILVHFQRPWRLWHVLAVWVRHWFRPSCCVQELVRVLAGWLNGSRCPLRTPIPCGAMIPYVAGDAVCSEAVTGFRWLSWLSWFLVPRSFQSNGGVVLCANLGISKGSVDRGVGAAPGMLTVKASATRFLPPPPLSPALQQAKQAERK